MSYKCDCESLIETAVAKANRPAARVFRHTVSRYVLLPIHKYITGQTAFGVLCEALITINKEWKLALNNESRKLSKEIHEAN